MRACAAACRERCCVPLLPHAKQPMRPCAHARRRACKHNPPPPPTQACGRAVQVWDALLHTRARVLSNGGASALLRYRLLFLSLACLLAWGLLWSGLALAVSLRCAPIYFPVALAWCDAPLSDINALRSHSLPFEFESQPVVDRWRRSHWTRARRMGWGPSPPYWCVALGGSNWSALEHGGGGRLLVLHGCGCSVQCNVQTHDRGTVATTLARPQTLISNPPPPTLNHPPASEYGGAPPNHPAAPRRRRPQHAAAVAAAGGRRSRRLEDEQVGKGCRAAEAGG